MGGNDVRNDEFSGSKFKLIVCATPDTQTQSAATVNVIVFIFFIFKVYLFIARLCEGVYKLLCRLADLGGEPVHLFGIHCPEFGW